MEPLRAAWALTLGLAVLRLGLAAQVGLGDDEAYYWTWALHPGLVAYDHPPLVAWLIAASTTVFGDAPWAVRLPFLLCGVATAGLIGGWTRAATGDPRAGAFAVLAFGLAPVFALGHVFAAPDMPALLATAGAGWAVHGAVGGRRGRWAVAGLAVGLGLWAKLTVGLVPLSVLGWLAWRRRPLLATAGPWLAAGVATLVFAPWLVAQAEAGWPTLSFHAVGRHGTTPGVGGLLAMVGGQLGYLSPVLAVVSLVAVWRGRVGWAAALAVPPIVLFTVAAALTRALPHWPAAGWLAALVPTGALLASRPRLAGATLGVAALATGLLHAHAIGPVVDLGPADPTHDPAGWAGFADKVSPFLARSERGCVGRLVGTRYQTASQAGYALGRDTAPIGFLHHPGLGALEPPGGCGPLFVVASDRYPLERDDCAPLVQHPVERGGAVVRTLSLHRCDD